MVVFWKFFSLYTTSLTAWSSETITLRGLEPVLKSLKVWIEDVWEKAAATNSRHHPRSFVQSKVVLGTVV